MTDKQAKELFDKFPKTQKWKLNDLWLVSTERIKLDKKRMRLIAKKLGLKFKP